MKQKCVRLSSSLFYWKEGRGQPSWIPSSCYQPRTQAGSLGGRMARLKEPGSLKTLWHRYSSCIAYLWAFSMGDEITLMLFKAHYMGFLVRLAGPKPICYSKAVSFRAVCRAGYLEREGGNVGRGEIRNCFIITNAFFSWFSCTWKRIL